MLGTLQDTAVARATTERIALQRSAEGPLVFAAGRLAERQAGVATEARARFPKAWGRLDRKKLRGWMKA